VSIISRLKKVNWIADVLTPAAVILTDVFWLYPWLVYFGQNSVFTIQKTALNPLSLIIILGLSFIVTRFFLKQKWPMIWIQTVIVACGLVVIFLILRNEYNDGSSLFSSQWFVTYGQVVFHFFASKHPFVLALVAGLYFWWRGISLGRSRLYFEDIYHAFIIELAIMVLLVIMWGISFKDQAIRTLTSDIVVYVVGFFFFGLVAMALSNLRIVQERLKTKGESSKYFGRRWFTIILTVIGGMVLLGIGFASIFSSQFISALQRFMVAASSVYDKVVTFLIYAIGYVVQLIGYVYLWFLSLFKHKPPPPKPTIPEDIGELNLKVHPQQPLPPWVILLTKLLILAMIIGFVLFLIFKAVRRRQSKQIDSDLEEENESLWSWGGFAADIKVFFEMLIGRFKRKKQPVVVNKEIKWRPDEDVQHRLSIRDIYQHLLWQGARLQIPREDFETPSEYALRLGQAVPESSEPLDRITGFYLDVRYGDQKPEDKKTDDANTVWQGLLNILNGHKDR
jgi:hypothetical protein